MNLRVGTPALCALGLALLAMPALADGFSSPSATPGFQPLVPVSAFARPAAWLDPSRLHFSTSMSVGSSFGGGTDALQLTSLSYQFKAPVSLRVSLGNAWGPSAASRGNSTFLEGIDLRFQPSRSLGISFQYRDLRSPLQLAGPESYGYWPR